MSEKMNLVNLAQSAGYTPGELVSEAIRIVFTSICAMCESEGVDTMSVEDDTGSQILTFNKRSDNLEIH